MVGRRNGVGGLKSILQLGPIDDLHVECDSHRQQFARLGLIKEEGNWQILSVEKTDTQVVKSLKDETFSVCRKASRLQEALEVLSRDTCHAEEP